MSGVEAMLDEAKKSLGMGEPNKIQAWYRTKVSLSGYQGNFAWCNAAVTFWAYHSDNGLAVCFDNYYAYTVAHAAKFRSKDQWHVDVNGIKRGDIVFFDWGGTNDLSRIDHVGIVEKVEGDKVYTIEGNTDDVCARRVRTAATIVGYGRPKYVEVKPEPVPVPEPKADEYVVKSGDTLSSIAKDHHTVWREIALLNELKDPNKISVGQVLKMPAAKPPAPKPGPPTVRMSHIRYGLSSGDTKKMQLRLIAKGFSIPSGATGYYGSQTKAAVKAAQKAQGFTGSDADGIVGKTTLGWLGLKVT